MSWSRLNQVIHATCACFQILEILEEGEEGRYQAADGTQLTLDGLTVLRAKGGEYMSTHQLAVQRLSIPLRRFGGHEFHGLYRDLVNFIHRSFVVMEELGPNLFDVRKIG